MEITINLPDQVFANISSLASKSHKGVDQVISEKIERDFSLDVEDLAKQVSSCSDSEILQLAKSRLPTAQDKSLSNLLQKQGEQNLSAREQKELWKLMELNRLTTLKKAFALRELAARNIDGQDQ